MVNGDILLFVPPPPFPHIFCDYAIFGFLCVNSSSNTFSPNHSQNTPNVSPSFDNKEDKSSIENPLEIPSTLFGNTEGVHFCFSSIALYDS